MFRLHDSTRRRIALAVFFTLGVMPMVAVSAWGLWWSCSRHVRAEAEQLSLRLGMKISLSGVRHPKPGVVVYEGLQALEPEGNQPVLACRQATVHWDETLGESNQRGLRVILSSPKIQASQWAEIWRLVQRLLTGRVESGNVLVELEAKDDELTILGKEFSQRLVHAVAWVERRPGGPRVGAEFRLAETPGSKPARLVAARNRQITPPVTEIELDPGGTPLPCRLLAVGLPGFDLLGPDSRFFGVLRATVGRDGPSGGLIGQLDDVDLQPLVSSYSRHPLSGTANITVKARFRGGRLEEADGTILGGRGMVGRSLLEAAQRLGMATVPLDRADPLVPYERMAISFALDAKGLRLGAMSLGRDAGMMLAGRFGPILSEPQPNDQPFPLAAVERALAPENDFFFPIARRPARTDRRPSAAPKAEPDGGNNPLRY